MISRGFPFDRMRASKGCGFMFHKTNPFYLSKEWRHLRQEVLSADKYECQHCKAKGKYTRATHVHHVNHLDKHPELALEKYYTDSSGNTKRNLISVCKDCHETVCHPERLTHSKPPLNEERW